MTSLPLLCDATTPTSNFTDNGNDTITDNKTGLMWKKCTEGQTGASCKSKEKKFSWEDALQYVKKLNEGGGFLGFKDWRLPTLRELNSLVEEQCVEPAINTTLFPNTPSKAYWTSSPYAGFSDYAWCVNYQYGYDSYVSAKYSGNAIRLVR